MHIEFIEIQNFRRLKSVRVDFAKETTVLVGANNSGKTSAMVALSHFLVHQNFFTTNDFTLSTWEEIDKIGHSWEQYSPSSSVSAPSIKDWEAILPSLDVWLNIKPDEFRFVRELLPTLDWEGGRLGIRLRFEPKFPDLLYREYLQERKQARDTLDKARAQIKGEDPPITIELWPKSMCDYLVRKLDSAFGVKAYILDPDKLQDPDDGLARIQLLPREAEFLEKNPLKNLIRIDEISAMRGFADSRNKRSSNESDDSNDRATKRKLSEQLRSYYADHVDPAEAPDVEDIAALQAISDAEKAFDGKLKDGLAKALREVETLGYPGVTDLELVVATKIKPIDGLKHPSALQYKLPFQKADEGQRQPFLPENYNGLGYQNLIAMVFMLMTFRDQWMEVGKKSRRIKAADDYFIPPLHLVLVEEPEAHLHVQVQQVFIRKAFDILRNHDALGDRQGLETQLIVTTHSSHIAHEADFSSLRYFSRRPILSAGEVPISNVINLSSFFKDEEETKRFVKRYLKTTHCDLFFADAAILVEGPAERILLPHFIASRFELLHTCYITLLEIGGSHAHRLRDFIEHLGITTLIISDIDTCKDEPNTLKALPQRNANLVTGNDTLKGWIPALKLYDDLAVATESAKVKSYRNGFKVRVSYQIPKLINFPDESTPVEALAYTFEDALVFENIELFKNLDGNGLTKKFKKALSESANVGDLSVMMFDALKSGKKADFALDVLYEIDPQKLKIPSYIEEGLVWLEEQLAKNRNDILISFQEESLAIEV